MLGSYLFQSARLGFRVWNLKDLGPLTEINSNPEVMQFFAAELSEEESKASIEKQIADYRLKGYCYFAVDELQSGELVGMIGLSEKKFPSTFTPVVDIGYRLSKNFWGKGYATEGAQRCLQFAFEQLKLDRIVSIASVGNKSSIRVMEKIGMHRLCEFKHPELSEHKDLVNCICYEIKSTARKLP